MKLSRPAAIACLLFLGGPLHAERLSPQTSGQQSLDRVTLPSVNFTNTPLLEVLAILNQFTPRLDTLPEENTMRGLNFVVVIPDTYKDLWTPKRAPAENAVSSNAARTVTFSGTNVTLTTFLAEISRQCLVRFSLHDNLAIVRPQHFQSESHQLFLVPTTLDTIRELYFKSAQDDAKLRRALAVGESGGLISLTPQLREHGLIKDTPSFVTYHMASHTAFVHMTPRDYQLLRTSTLSLQTPAYAWVEKLRATPVLHYTALKRPAHLVVKDLESLLRDTHGDTAPPVELFASNKDKLTAVTLDLRNANGLDLLDAFCQITDWHQRITEAGIRINSRTPTKDWEKRVYRIHASLHVMLINENPKTLFTSVGLPFPLGASILYEANEQSLTIRNTKAHIAWLETLMPHLNK